MLGVIIAVILSLVVLLLLSKYLKLVGKVEQRARELFERWSERELERLANEKAELLFEKWEQEYEDKIRKDAIEKSRAVITGKVTEHFAPYLPEFKFNPKDARFIGSPIDFIVFDGLDEGDLRRIVFIEVKSGKSTLNKREKLIEKVIENGLVEWKLLRFE